jgi:kumamolisin
MKASSHVAVSGSERKVRQGARAVGPANPHEWVSLTLKLRRANPLPPLVTRPKQVLPRDGFADKYGSSADDMSAVKSALTKLGVSVLADNRATRTVKVGGALSVMEQAFHVRLLQYQYEDEEYRGRVGPVHVPRELDGIVVGVFGFDNRRMVHRRRRASKTNRVALSAVSSGTRSWFAPSELADIYEFPPGDAAGETIGLLEFGGGYFREDLAAFYKALGAAGTAEVIPIGVDHTPTDRRDGAEGEVMLDVEIVAALCPKARIPVYFAEWSEKGWIDILDAAIHDTQNNPTILSISYGLAEGQDTWTDQALDQVDQAFQEAAQMGVTICVASGDDGTDAQVGDGYAHVNFPASSPHVLTVGGTNLLAPDRRTRQSETAWMQGDGLRADNGGSTGGGVSSHFQKPSWQTVEEQSINPNGATGRCVPDVAAVANFASYLLVVDGSAGPNGGTSAATPLWASLLGRINAALVSAGKARVGFLTPLLYAKTAKGEASLGGAACFDVTSGNNDTASGVGGYKAGPGYDCVTGWGSPRGTQLLSRLKDML